MTGVMTQWMKDRLERKREEARQQGRQQGRLEACREANAWAREQGLNPPFPDLEDGLSKDR